MKKYSVAMIDDDRDFSEIFSLLLNREFNVLTYVNGGEALEDLTVHEVDLVLLDLHMQEENGFEVYQKLKKFKSDLPVLFFTADDEVTNILADTDYILKTLSSDEIISKLKERLLSSANTTCFDL